MAAVLTLAAYLVFSWSFERGFVQYLHRADEAVVDGLVAAKGTVNTLEQLDGLTDDALAGLAAWARRPKPTLREAHDDQLRCDTA